MTVKTTNNLGVLLRSYEALHNWRALAMLAGSFILAGLATMGGTAAAASSGSFAVGVLMGLLGAIIAIVGMNASGLMLVDQAYDQPVRGFGAAFFGGLQAALSVIGALILLGLGFAVVLLAAYLLSLLGRIPGVGGFFGFVLGGPSVVVVALGYAVLVLAAPLMVAAIWHGEGLIASLSRAADIVIKKPLEVFMYFLVLGLIVLPAAVFIFGLVFGASTVVGGMYAAGSLASDYGVYGDPSGDGGGAGSGVMHMFAGAMTSHGFGGAGVSIGLVLFLAWSVVSLIYVLGLIFVYRAVNEGVGSEAADLVGQRLSQFKQKLDDYKPRAGIAPAATPVASPAANADATSDAGSDATPAASAPQPTSSPAEPAGSQGGTPAQPDAAPAAKPQTSHCPACGAEVASDDAFCGSCGHKLT